MVNNIQIEQSINLITAISAFIAANNKDDVADGLIKKESLDTANWVAHQLIEQFRISIITEQNPKRNDT